MRGNALVFSTLGLPALLVGLGCGGGSSAASHSTTSGSLTIAYTAPTPADGQPVVVYNTALSSGSYLVFDVVGSTTTTVRGLALNLQVDPTKFTAADVPTDASQVTARPVTTPTIGTGGWGGGHSVIYRVDHSDGLALMANTLRHPATPLPASGVLMRFAYNVIGTPVSGVVRAEVMEKSGLLDSYGRLISGTAPVIGRIEIKQ